MQYYPNNTVTHYTTRLESPISLSGDWEVALLEVQYQHTWNNLDRRNGLITYYQNMDRDGRLYQYQNSIRLPSGYYATPNELTTHINKFIEGTAQKFKFSTYTKFNYSDITKRISANINKDTTINFSPVLCSMLGIDSEQNPLSNTESLPLEWMSNHVCDVSRGFSALYIYCSILEHIPVGDTKAPLLRIVNVSGKSGDIVQVIYDRPLYVPLQQRNFDNVEIDVRSDTGESVPFEYGKLVVTLHFRRCKIPYLLQ